MRVIRFNTALGLLLTGVLLMGAQLVLLTGPSLIHPGVAETVLNADGTHNTQAAPCHDESAPTNQTPENHDCCTVGHLHVIASAQVIIAPSFIVTSADNSFIPSASLNQAASPTRRVSDTGPPGSAVPIRV